MPPRRSRGIPALRLPVWPENSTGPIPLAILMLRLFARPAELLLWAGNHAAKRAADVADHPTDTPSPDTEHTSDAPIPTLPVLTDLNLPDQAASR